MWWYHAFPLQKWRWHRSFNMGKEWQPILVTPIPKGKNVVALTFFFKSINFMLGTCAGNGSQWEVFFVTQYFEYNTLDVYFPLISCCVEGGTLECCEFSDRESANRVKKIVQSGYQSPILSLALSFSFCQVGSRNDENRTPSMSQRRHWNPVNALRIKVTNFFYSNSQSPVKSWNIGSRQRNIKKNNETTCPSSGGMQLPNVSAFHSLKRITLTMDGLGRKL